MSYGEMAEDIRDMMDQLGLSRSIIIGHSMGGKTAMQFALDFPDRVQKLVCVDIAPRRYEARHNKILKALSGLDPSAYHSRQAMELALAPCIPDIQVRRFLLKGVHLEEGTFRWRMGIHEIAGNYDKLSAEIKGSGVFDGPVLFVRGELSDYLRPEDEPRILRSFPNAKFCCIPNASHWVHADNPEGFRRPVAEFLEQPQRTASRR